MLCISWGGWGWGKPFPFAFLVHSDFPGTSPIIVSYGAKSGLVGRSEMGDYCKEWCNFGALRQSLLVSRARTVGNLSTGWCQDPFPGLSPPGTSWTQSRC